MSSVGASPSANALRRLWPYAAACGLLFSGLATLAVVFGAVDLQRSLDELPKRLVYSAAMSISFATSLGIAAYCALDAAVKLRRISGEPNTEDFGAALHALTRFLRAFFAWVMALASIILVSIFLPAY